MLLIIEAISTLPHSSLLRSQFNQLNTAQCGLTPATFGCLIPKPPRWTRSVGRACPSGDVLAACGRSQETRSVWERQRECVFKGHAGLHYKAEGPLMRSEETVGVTAPFSLGVGLGVGGSLPSSITIRADGHMGVFLTTQWFYYWSIKTRPLVLGTIRTWLWCLYTTSPKQPPTPRPPPAPKCRAHLQFLIDIRVNESPWNKQPAKAYLHRVKMQVAADVKFHLPPAFITPMFAECLRRMIVASQKV